MRFLLLSFKRFPAFIFRLCASFIVISLYLFFWPVHEAYPPAFSPLYLDGFVYRWLTGSIIFRFCLIPQRFLLPHFYGCFVCSEARQSGWTSLFFLGWRYIPEKSLTTPVCLRHFYIVSSSSVPFPGGFHFLLSLLRPPPAQASSIMFLFFRASLSCWYPAEVWGLGIAHFFKGTASKERTWSAADFLHHAL